MAATGPARRYVILITGASRGFGKSLAVACAKEWSPTTALDMHLIARNKNGLEATKKAVEASCPIPGGLRVWTWSIDLGDLESLENKLDDTFAEISKSSVAHRQQHRSSEKPHAYDKAYLFNNAGLVGPIAYAQDLHKNLQKVRHAIDMNVTSFIYLTSLFVDHFGGPRQDLPSSSSASSTQEKEGEALPMAKESVLVNISSLAAVQPFQSWGMYCAGKASRDMFTHVVAKEQQHDDDDDSQPPPPSSIAHKTLNYAPGPLDTDMQTELRESDTIHQPTKEWSVDAFKEGKLVTPEASAAKCIKILQENRFESGAHIDYYDEV